MSICEKKVERIMFEDLEPEYSRPNTQGTGEFPAHETSKTIVYPFGKYEITVELSADNKFISILEVKINKDFLSYEQKNISKGFHDVDRFYEE